MGFLVKTIAKTVIKRAGDITLAGIIDHVQDTRSADAIVKKSKAKHKLFIKQKGVVGKRKFAVTNERDTEKYLIQTGRRVYGYPSIYLCDTDGDEIGRVERAYKIDPTIYDVYLDDSKIGMLKRRLSAKVKMELDLNGWRLEGNLVQNNFVVTDKNGEIVVQLNRAYASRDTYVMEINNRENEVLGLLLFAAVEIALHGDQK